MQIQRHDVRFLNQSIHIQTEAKPQVDTWLTTDYKTGQRSVEVSCFFTYFAEVLILF
jgi:hypothetical protein